MCDVDDRGPVGRKLLESSCLISCAILWQTTRDGGGILIVETPRAEDLEPCVFGSGQTGFDVGLGLKARSLLLAMHATV